jgi:glycosyltransferase involved in cell wall biosynthesis
VLTAASAIATFEPERVPARRFGILSTYPPTPCGLATFSAALARGFQAVGAAVDVVRVADGQPSAHPDVVGELTPRSPRSRAAAAALLNGCDVAVIQHEYGLYGGTDGDEVLDVIRQLDIPSIVIAHTILRDASPNQRAILCEVAARTDRLVVMSEAARTRLCAHFPIDPAKVTTIQHGAAVPRRPRIVDPYAPPLLLTWGLLGPGKGIERVIDALPHLRDRGVRYGYLVAGQTHPKVLAADGEAYRDARIDQARRLGVGESVTFDSCYRDVPTLTGLIQSAAVVVLPYDTTEQVTSGVLVDALAAGRPVVATRFPHAEELLASGAGIVVDHGDGPGLARALHRLLVEPALAASMAGAAAALAPSLSWPVIAGAYVGLAERLRADRVALA